MKVLIAALPLTGHINPMLSIGRILMAEGHEVVVLSGSTMRKRIEGIGAPFRPLPSEADLDLGNIVAVFPELKTIPPGPELVRFYFEHVFIDLIPPQHEGMRQVL